MRLSESKQSGDIRTGFRAYNQQQKDALAAAKKKPSGTLLEVPRTLSDAISMICAMMMQQSATLHVKQGLAYFMATLIEKHPIHLEATDVELILNSLLLSVQAKHISEGI
jgi:hypothetical protein